MPLRNNDPPTEVAQIGGTGQQATRSDQPASTPHWQRNARAGASVPWPAQNSRQTRRRLAHPALARHPSLPPAANQQAVETQEIYQRGAGM